MTEELYQKLSAEFERLDAVHGPLDLDENGLLQEDRRLRFAEAWRAFLNSQNVEWDDFDRELERRLMKKFGEKHGTHKD